MLVNEKVYHNLLGSLTIIHKNNDIIQFLELGNKKFNLIETEKYLCDKNTYLEKEFVDDDVMKICDLRDIKYIKHITTISNALKILKKGFIPRNQLNAVEIKNDFKKDFLSKIQIDNFEKSEFSDEQRLDCRTDCNCFSVSLVNLPLFKTYKNRHPNYRYCTITLDASMLKKYYGNSYYFYYNAATKVFRGYSKSQLKDLKYFNLMFKDEIKINNYYGTHTIRRNINYKSCIPTSEQAEVLIDRIVDPRFIKKISFENEMDYNTFTTNCDSVDADIELEVGNIYYG